MACTDCNDPCKKEECVDCQDCGCDKFYDAACVKFYKKDLPCIGKPEGTDLEQIIEEIDTKLCGVTNGSDGLSAYQIAVSDGFTGTESEWLDSSQGPEGPQGPTGPQGPEGPAGADGANFSTRTTNVTSTGSWVTLMNSTEIAATKTVLNMQSGQFQIMVGQATGGSPVQYEDAVANGTCTGLRYNNSTGEIEGMFSTASAYRVTLT